MRLFALSLMAVCALALGCNKPVETIPSVAPATSAVTDGDHEGHSHAEGEGHDDDSAALSSGSEIRFVADKSLSVPDMQCPYSCYPAVKEALAAVPGVEGVQLAEQPAGTPEGKIDVKVVELKLADGFDPNAAIAALKAANYDSQVVN